MSIVLFFYGMIAYAGLRFRAAREGACYAKLVAAGIASVILIQATVNFFAVLGVLPLTGVPLPFISYGNSNLVVLLAGDGDPHERVAAKRRAAGAAPRGRADGGRASEPRYKEDRCQPC